MWVVGIGGLATWLEGQVLSMGEYRKLLVWQKAHGMAVSVDRAAGKIRGGAHAALRNQMIRAALSVPANIVEGRSQ